MNDPNTVTIIQASSRGVTHGEESPQYCLSPNKFVYLTLERLYKWFSTYIICSICDWLFLVPLLSIFTQRINKVSKYVIVELKKNDYLFTSFLLVHEPIS